MGFSREVVKDALKASKGDEQQALDLLLADHSTIVTSSSSSSSSTPTASSAIIKGAVLRRPTGAPAPVDINAFKFKCDVRLFCCAN
jgi:hypothetical protein